jgi:Cdc6-like AAA superfamily ATPase
MISILIAKKLKGELVRTFNPSEPGDSISSLYNQVSPNKNKPLIIVFDEVDIMMDKIYNNKIVPHKHIPIEIQDKSSWNRFFDDINLGLYPYVILVLTSNTFANNIETKYDSSYIRDGRVHVKCEL